MTDIQIPFTLKDVQKPLGSNALAKRFLESLNKVNQFANAPTANADHSDPENQNLSNTKHNNLRKTASSKTQSREDDSVEESDRNKDGGHKDNAKNILDELNKPLDRDNIPMIALAKPDQALINTYGFARTSIDETRDEIMDMYPNIPIKKIPDIDMYLVAYESFLATWKPNLEFHYSDPGKIEGHLNTLQNAIKLAFYDQYKTVRAAYLEVKEKIFNELDIKEPRCEAHRLLDENRITPEVFDKMVDDVFKNLNSREILDINGHKGNGYFLIWKDPKEGGLYALPTIGVFGHFLPEPGFSIIKEHGWPYFRNTAIIGFQIGHLRKVLIENQDGEWEDWELRGPVYLEVSELEYDDNSVSRIQIDGCFFQGTVYSTVE